jgi:hypothetical protein
VLVSLPKAVDACVFYTLGERHLAHDPDRPGTYGSITMIGHPAPSPSPNAFVSAEQRLRDSRILLLISRPARAVGVTPGASSSLRCARMWWAAVGGGDTPGAQRWETAPPPPGARQKLDVGAVVQCVQPDLTTVLEVDPGAAAVAFFCAAVLTEIYPCNVCSCQEILRRSGRGQAARRQQPRVR